MQKLSLKDLRNEAKRVNAVSLSGNVYYYQNYVDNLYKYNNIRSIEQLYYSSGSYGNNGQLHKITTHNNTFYVYYGGNKNMSFENFVNAMIINDNDILYNRLRYTLNGIENEENNKALKQWYFIEFISGSYLVNRNTSFDVVEKIRKILFSKVLDYETKIQKAIKLLDYRLLDD